MWLAVDEMSVAAASGATAVGAEVLRPELAIALTVSIESALPGSHSARVATELGRELSHAVVALQTALRDQASALARSATSYGEGNTVVARAVAGVAGGVVARS